MVFAARVPRRRTFSGSKWCPMTKAKQTRRNRNDNARAEGKADQADLETKREHKGVFSMNEQAEQHIEKVTQGLMKACEDINAVCCESVSAVAQSNAAFTKGCEELSRNFGSLMQEQIARTMSASKTFLGAKSLKEYTDLQSEFVKDCFEQWMSGTGKMSEISARAAKETIEPVAKHATLTMSKVAQQVQQAKAAA
jgi:phasin family protein